MSRSMYRLAALSTCLAATMMAGAGSAAEVTTTKSQTQTFTAFDDTLGQTTKFFPNGVSATFQPFDSAWGALDTVTVTWTYTADANLIVGPTGGSFGFGYGGYFYINSAEYNGAGGGGGGGGPPGSSVSASFNIGTQSQTFIIADEIHDLPIYSAFTGDAPFTALYTSPQESFGANHVASGIVTETGTVSVEYNFTPAPEPASWALMLIGVGAVGGALRARRGLSTKAA